MWWAVVYPSASTLEDPHRVGQRHLRIPRDLPQPATTPHRPRDANPDRIRENPLRQQRNRRITDLSELTPPNPVTITRVAAINELKALVVTAPVGLRDQLRDLSTAALVTKCEKFRLRPATVGEHTATKTAMRSLARRIRTLTTEIAELKTPIAELVKVVVPQLLNQPGIGPITAAQVFIAWPHPRRCRNEAAFARLAGVAPLEASSGQRTRHRLNRRGDRQLNRALHNIAITRTRHCPKTQAYIAKRISQGKTTREARRCLKRYIARHLYRLLENPPPNPENSPQPQTTPPKSSNNPHPRKAICKT